MTRNFGIMNGRASLGGMSTDAAANSAVTHADLLPSERDQETAAKCFGLLCCASPFVIFGVCYAVIKLFS